jgi:hypothetical protein
LARAKNTDRAEARRRHREQTRVSATEDLEADITPDEAVAAPAVTQRSMFAMPNLLEDLRILPGMLLGHKRLWIPFALLIASFFLALALDRRFFPAGADQIVGTYVALTLPPTALFVFFIGGFLAPRASYLVGAVLGLIDGILYAIVLLLAPPAATPPPAGTQQSVATPLDVLLVIAVAVVFGTLAAGFAAWYRNFLRQSQERARANRLAREQQAKIKAKEDARKEREAQRQATAAARQATTAAPTSTPK